MDNLRGSLLMVFAMAGFAIEDMFIKQLAENLPVGMILALLGAGGALIFGALALAQGNRIWSRDLLHRGVMLRNLGEVVGTCGFVSALALTPISSASAILQAVPLAVTLGAALFLRQQVGWRRWSAIGFGFAGVLLVIRPGMDGFEPASLLAVVGVIGLAGRDLATRIVPAAISSTQLSAYAFGILVPTGLVLLAVTGGSAPAPATAEWLRLGGALGFGVVAYAAIVAASRIGEIAVIAPFRYSRIVFALVVGALVFGERPDAMTLAGAAMIVASGIYTLTREARLRRQERRASLAARAKL